MKDITYCTSIACPSKECRIKVTNNRFQPGDIISMADFSGTCRFYIGWMVDKIEAEEEPAKAKGKNVHATYYDVLYEGNDMSLCKLCKCPGCAVRGSEYDFASCPSYEPMSHGDRIRAKSDEELAEFFGTLPCCPPGEDLEELCFPLDSCEGTEMKVKCWLKWLRQEAKE